MVDKTDYSIGHYRLKYLDLANMNFAQGNFVQADGFIKAFMDTIKDESQAAIDIKLGFDEITTRKKHQIEQLFEHTSTLGYLEKKDTETEGREEIEINTIHDKKIICWRVCMKYGLFNE